MTQQRPQAPLALTRHTRPPTFTNVEGSLMESCRAIWLSTAALGASSLPAAPAVAVWAQPRAPLGPTHGLSMLWAILAGLAILFLLIGVMSYVFHRARRLRKMRTEHPKTVMHDIWFLNPPPPRKRPSGGDPE